MRTHAKLIHVRLRRDDEAMILEPLDHRRLKGTLVLAETARGRGRREIDGADVVFYRYRVSDGGFQSAWMWVSVRRWVSTCSDIRMQV